MKHKISISYIADDPPEWFWDCYKNGDNPGILEYLQNQTNIHSISIEKA